MSLPTGAAEVLGEPLIHLVTHRFRPPSRGRGKAALTCPPGPVMISAKRRTRCSAPKEAAMTLFLIERNFAEELEVNQAGVRAVTQINADVGVNWLFSFLSADKKKTYCLYEAPSADLIREAARRANLPADVVIEVSEINAAAFA
jgi:hypothetical protein